MLEFRDIFEYVCFLIKPSPDGPFIAGGTPMRIVGNMDTHGHDIDIWCTSTDQFNHISSIFDSFKLDVFITKNASTYKIPFQDELHLVQVINKIVDNRVDCVSDFDIRACKVVYDGEFHYSKNTYNDIINKNIFFDNFSENSIARLTKYVGYGFKPDYKTIEAVIDRVRTLGCEVFESTVSEDYGQLT